MNYLVLVYHYKLGASTFGKENVDNSKTTQWVVFEGFFEYIE